MRYRLSLPDPHTHLFHVEAVLDGPGEVAEFHFPVWTPGSYLIREFARHVEGLSAEDGEGRALAVERLDKHRVRVRAGAPAQLVLRFRVFAHELTVRTCHVDDSHGYLNGAAVFPYVPGRTSEPHLLEVVPPAGWTVATALEGGPTHFTAKDYDALADAPLEIGTHRVLSFTAQGKRHDLALWGKARIDEERLLEDLRRIVDGFAALMGGLPYERYLFIIHLSDKRRGGLEHADSTTLNIGRGSFWPREAYEETLALFAHEFFHLWNVKRLRPAALTPYDYAREQYTRLLWWFEGVTSYYDQLMLARAGLVGPARHLKRLGQAFTTLERTPGAKKSSAEESSFLAWVKLYRPDENTVNSTVSYYLKGELVAFALDLALRRAGGSLDALLRTLYERHAKGGLPENGVEPAVAEVLGVDGARRFFDRWVRGTEPLEPDLAAIGLRLRRRAAAGLDDKGGTPNRVDEERGAPGWLGAELGQGQGPRLVVQAVREGSPAWRGGLYPEDELVAEGGFRLDKGGLWDRLCQEGPQGRLRLTVFRRDELREVVVPLAAPPEDTVWIEPLPDASQEARAAFQAWCGAAFPQ